MKDDVSDIPSIGCDIDRNIGAISATPMFICIVYDTNEAELPPSLAVMTAAAVAVGQIVQSMAASSMARALSVISLKMAIVSDMAMNAVNWNSSNQRCHFAGFISLIRTLQNVTKSIRKISVGCKKLTALFTKVCVQSRKGIFVYSRYIVAPPIIAIGSDHIRRYLSIILFLYKWR